MPLEAGNHIPELNANNPLGGDPKSEGDDHLRLIKRATLGSFPAFVGTIATPKSVSLTEDQINDAALKSAAQTISGAWLHTGVQTFQLLSVASLDNVDTSARFISLVHADGTLIGAMGGLGSAALIIQNRVLGGNVEFEAFNTGGSPIVGLQYNPSTPAVNIVDRAGTIRAAGFRPGAFDISGGLTLRQDHEQNTITATGVGQGFGCEQLSTGTVIRISTEFGTTGVIISQGAGVTIRTHQGGAQFGGNIAMAPSSVCELHWRSPTEVRAWGNGLSPSP